MSEPERIDDPAPPADAAKPASSSEFVVELVKWMLLVAVILVLGVIGLVVFAAATHGCQPGHG